MPALVGVVLAFLGRFLGDSLVKYVAWKILIITLLTVTLPIVLKNLIVWLMDTVFTAVSGAVQGGTIPAAVLHFTGLGAYLAIHLRFADCLAVIIAGAGIAVALKFIPFIGK